ncbi:hypothetical protein [Bradyrhizobium sp. UFLA05-112]
MQSSAMRIHLLHRVLGTIFVDDPERAVAYVRPASDDPQKARTSLLLGFVPVEAEPANFFNPDGTAIAIDRYRQLYVELTQTRRPIPRSLRWNGLSVGGFLGCG